MQYEIVESEDAISTGADGLADVGRRRRRHPGGGTPASRTPASRAASPSKAAAGRRRKAVNMMQHRIQILENLSNTGNAHARRALQAIVALTDRVYRATKARR